MRLVKIPLKIVSFMFFYLYNLIRSNLVIAADILSPNLKNDPVFVEAPVTLKSKSGLLLFSNLLSMTPGTLSYDISADLKVITVHFLYKRSKEKMLSDIAQIQNRIKQILE